MATIRDVAAQAGVSIATVSRVLNERQSAIPISEETRQRVLAAAKELDYEPNFLARGLAGKKTDTIGLVMYDLAHALHPNFSQYVHGIASVLRESPYDLLLLPLKSKLRGDSSVSLKSYFKQRRVDGMIIAAQEAWTDAVLDLDFGLCPAVVLGAHLPETKLPGVRADVGAGLASLVDHLLGLGHRRIAFINGPKGLRLNDDMAVGYRSALARVGLYDQDWLVTSDFSSEKTRKRAKELLCRADPPTAIIAADDLMAADVLEVAAEAGLQVPNELSVAGFADLPIARGVNPQLTSVSVPIAELGCRAAELLLGLLSGVDQGESLVTLPTELVVRGSTGPPAGTRS